MFRRRERRMERLEVQLREQARLPLILVEQVTQVSEDARDARRLARAGRFPTASRGWAADLPRRGAVADRAAEAVASSD